MPGRALLLTVDTYLGDLVERVAREASIQVEACETVEAAATISARNTFDVVVVDCDDVHSGISFVRRVRRSWTTKNAAVIAVLNGATPAYDAVDAGADYTVEKVNSGEQLRTQLLTVCRALEHREHERVAIKVPVYVTTAGIVNRRAQSFNISEGGIGLQFADPILEDELLSFRFELPDCDHRFQLRGEIAWADATGRMGAKFVDVAAPAAGKLKHWLGRRRASKISGQN